MFNFKKKILSPVVADIRNQIEHALKVPSVADRVEQLLSVKDAANKKLDNLETHEELKSLLFLGLAAVGASTLLMLSVLPAVVFGFIAVAVAPPVLITVNANRISDARQGLDQKIGDAVTSLVRSAPQEAAKSSRFMKVFAPTFNGSAVAKGAPSASAASKTLSGMFTPR